jgi:hypothetical protein
MIEIDQRLVTWSKTYKPAKNDQLQLSRYRGVRLFGRFHTWGYICFETIWALFSLITLWCAAIEFFYYHHPKYGWYLVGLAAVFFCIITLINRWYVRKGKFRP